MQIFSESENSLIDRSIMEVSPHWKCFVFVDVVGFDCISMLKFGTEVLHKSLHLLGAFRELRGSVNAS